MDALHQFEITLILFLQSLGTWLVEPMRLVTMLGSEEFFMLVMPSLYWSINSVLGFRVAIILILSNGFSALLKLAFHSPRPYWFDPQVRGYVAEHSFGMPSTHAQSAAGVWGLIASASRQNWEKATLAAVIFLIGFSRVYLGVHFISDVVVGWLAGGLLLLLFLKIERPVWAWLRKRSFNQMLALALVTAAFIALMNLVPAAALSGWQPQAEWVKNALASQPEAGIDPLNLDGAFTLSGTWFGLMAGAAWLYHRRGGYDASGTPRQRLLRYVIGVAGIYLLWFGLGRVFPRHADVLSFTLRFFRYTLVGLWISALAPLLFERMGLALAPKNRVPPLSSGENPL
jgi:membrane-associated phospholipid phosphatase